MLSPETSQADGGILGVLSDATKSVSRAYINNFQDKSKQVAIDMFLVGTCCPRRNYPAYGLGIPGQYNLAETGDDI